MTNQEEVIMYALQLVSWHTPLDAPEPPGVNPDAWTEALTLAVHEECLDARTNSYKELDDLRYRRENFEMMPSRCALDSLKVIKKEIKDCRHTINEVESKLALYWGQGA